MGNKIALVIGSTGLVGEQLTKQLLLDDNYKSVHVFVRRLMSPDIYLDPHKKLITHVVNYNDIPHWQSLLKGDNLFCCIGTTLKQAGSKENQTKVDLEIPSDIAKYANSNGVKNAVLVSAAGAKTRSSSFYLDLKGRLEQNYSGFDWQKLIIVRPSFLDGYRKQFRFGEQFAILLFKVLKYIPWIKKYRPIRAEQVAKRMRLLANKNLAKEVVIEELEQLFQE